MIDIFDCSSIDFFLDSKTLTPEDPNLLFTIKDTNLHGTAKLENSFLRFSNEHQYIYINQFRKTLIIYDLTGDEKIIEGPIIMETIPSYYECIVNLSIEEDELEESIIAAKKSEFRNIEFFSIGFLKDLNKH